MSTTVKRPEPTENGAKILEIIRSHPDARQRSIGAFARRAGIHEVTVRRRIFKPDAERPTSMELRTVEAFEKQGVPRTLLNLA